MSIEWLRLWHDMPTDPKWRVIAKRSGQSIPEVIAVFIFVMTNASANASERGRTNNLFADDIAAALDMETEQIEAILTAMQGKVLDGDRLHGWEKRQPKREDGSAERAREWRERKRTQANANERPDKDTESESESEEDKESTRGARKRATKEVFAYMGKVIRLNQPDYDRWRKTYSHIPDFVAELTKADDYYRTHPPHDGQWFFRVSQWLDKANKDALADKKRNEDPIDRMIRLAL